MKALEQLGILCFGLNLLDNPLNDVLNPQVESRILEKIRAGQILFVWHGPSK